MEKKYNIQDWMKENSYDTIRFYPQNVSAYGVSDMINSANLAIKYLDDSTYISYEDNIETFFS